MSFEEYIEPSLLVLVPVLYLIGMALKRSAVKDNLIPLFVGVCGVLLACLYLMSTKGVCAETLFAGIVQGILCAGASVYVNQTCKQIAKSK